MSALRRAVTRLFQPPAAGRAASGTYRRLPSAARLIAGLAGLVVLGTALLLLPGVATEGYLDFGHALFTAVSALCVTGLSLITPATDLTRFGQLILAVLIQVGGVGFMTLAVVVFRLIGRKVMLLDRLALQNQLGLVSPGAVLQIVRRVLITALLIETIGAIFLWTHWRGLLGDERALFYAAFHAISAFCNAGFDLFTGASGLPANAPPGIPSDSFSLFIIGALIFLGGLGIPVISDLAAWPRQRRLSLHTRITLVVVAALVCIGSLSLMLAENNRLLADQPFTRRLAVTTFQSVSARTAGFVSVTRFADLAPASQITLIALMFVGCAPASMGGGITTGTLATLTLALWSYTRGMPSPQVGGRSIGRDMVNRAAAVLTVSLLAVIVATWLILITHPATLDEALFEVVSAFATCGLSLDFTTRLNPFGQIVIMVMMFWGRLGALTIIAALAQQRPALLVAYPEEQVLIG